MGDSSKKRCAPGWLASQLKQQVAAHDLSAFLLSFICSSSVNTVVLVRLTRLLAVAHTEHAIVLCERTREGSVRCILIPHHCRSHRHTQERQRQNPLPPTINRVSLESISFAWRQNYQKKAGSEAQRHNPSFPQRQALSARQLILKWDDSNPPEKCRGNEI